MRKMAWAWALAAVLAAPGGASALDLISPGGFRFDILETTTGSLSDGGHPAMSRFDAYDGMYYLNVDGIQYSARGTAATMSLGGRQVEMAETMVGALSARRLVYVPSGSAGMNYARFLDLVRNPTAAPVMATIRIDGNLGSDGSTVVTGSSSGDLVVSAADDWFTTDDSSDGAGDPELGHVLQGAGAPVRATSVSLSTDSPSWSFTVMIPAGGRVGILTFAIQENGRPASIAESRRVVDLPSDAMEGLDAYAGDIVNFAVGGAPIVRFMAPATADEGDAIPITIEVEDLEGDPATWSWDTNDDGVFGEHPNATSYTVPAGSTDGPGSIRIGVEASDGTDARRVYRTIAIQNVAPVITSTPPARANVRREYSYTPAVDDPAGERDPLRFILVTRPMGMDLDSSTGRITWTPSLDQRARAFDVALRVDDGDGGEDMQAWSVMVADNVPPDPPAPVSPIERARVPEGAPVTLTVRNATDPDGDELVYFFRIGRTSRFDGPEVVGSGELSEDPSGMTSWTTPAGLERGLWYWEVWADDEIAESIHRYAQFVVGEGGGADASIGGDGGVGPARDAGTGGGGGGGCAATPDRTPSPAWLIGLAALALAGRRRRRA
ncbi:MAG: putative Ig domain-containing protein [Sandaracinaceae bacterium]|nr:putative Ig domain-containing protein [Sandaracinaceae bacterium]